MIKHKSVGCIVFRQVPDMEEPEYLLLKHSLGHWDFPKGHIENEETEEETGLRELEEETGLSKAVAELLPDFKETIHYSYYHAGKKHVKEVVVFLVQASDFNVKISHEHTAFDWLSFDQALKTVTYENTRTLLQNAHAFIQKRNTQKNLTQF
jgi:bis(5'-nucleosidyl)-tetraphosphatase